MAEECTEPKTPDEIFLDQLRAALVTVITTGESYAIQGSRSFKFTTAESIERLISIYEKKVSEDPCSSVNICSGIVTDGRNYVRFA